MGLFDKVQSATATYTPTNEQEAWTSLIYAAVKADGSFSNVETDHVARMLTFNSFFNGHTPIDYLKKVMVTYNGVDLKVVIDGAAKAISEDNKATVLASVIDAVYVDGSFGDKEKEIVEYIAKALNLPNETAEKIVEVMVIKNKYNRIFLS